jgi:putative transcriptional regulator
MRHPDHATIRRTLRCRSGAALLPRLLLGFLALGLIAATDGKGRVDDFESHAGELLVAAESMPDPRFRESVILMVRHNAEGAMGLIVNKTIAVAPLAMLFKDPDSKGKSFQHKVAVHYGGPVEPRRGFVVHRLDFAMDGTLAVKNGYGVTSNIEVLQALGEGTGPKQAVIAFGYAGWAPGQLEAEIGRGDWHWVPADDDLVFGPDNEDKWRRALEKRGVDL